MGEQVVLGDLGGILAGTGCIKPVCAIMGFPRKNFKKPVDLI
jgi:hypothetical protein